MADSDSRRNALIMSRFRQRLNEDRVAVEPSTLAELEWSAQQLVRLYLGKSARPRPSAVRRELAAMAKGLYRAAQAAERMGEEGMLHLLVASCANREPDNLDPRPHVEYLTRMARWAERAAEIAALNSQSERDHKGGRTPDENLRSLVVLLMARYQELLSRLPVHTVDPETGLGDSLSDAFIKMAITQFRPEGVTLEPRRIDEAIHVALKSRDIETFPPRLPDE